MNRRFVFPYLKKYRNEANSLENPSGIKFRLVETICQVRIQQRRYSVQMIMLSLTPNSIGNVAALGSFITRQVRRNHERQ
jgi:hypothetical protein